MRTFNMYPSIVNLKNVSKTVMSLESALETNLDPMDRRITTMLNNMKLMYGGYYDDENDDRLTDGDLGKLCNIASKHLETTSKNTVNYIGTWYDCDRSCEMVIPVKNSSKYPLLVNCIAVLNSLGKDNIVPRLSILLHCIVEDENYKRCNDADDYVNITVGDFQRQEPMQVYWDYETTKAV